MPCALFADVEKRHRAVFTKNCLRRLAAPALGERQVDHALVFLQSVAANADALRLRRRAKFDAASFALRGKDLRLFLRLSAGNLGFGFGAGCNNLLLTFISEYGSPCFRRQLRRSWLSPPPRPMRRMYLNI